MKNCHIIDINKDGYIKLVLNSSDFFHEIEFYRHLKDFNYNLFEINNYLIICRNNDILFIFEIIDSFATSPNEYQVFLSIKGKDITRNFNAENMEEFWAEISCDIDISEEFIDKFSSRLDWYELCYNHPMTEQFMEKHINDIKWFPLCKKQKLSEEFIEKHSDKVVWYGLHHSQKLSDAFIERHKDKLEFVI